MRPRLALSLLAGIALIAGTAACSDDEDGNPTTADITVTTDASSKTITAFSPNPFEMPLATNGGKVTWVNADGVDHDIESDDDLFDFDLSPGATNSHTFTAAGTYPYHCSIHPNMVGTILITE
jgi:plastocyanin